MFYYKTLRKNLVVMAVPTKVLIFGIFSSMAF